MHYLSWHWDVLRTQPADVCALAENGSAWSLFFFAGCCESVGCGRGADALSSAILLRQYAPPNRVGRNSRVQQQPPPDKPPSSLQGALSRAGGTPRSQSG